VKIYVAGPLFNEMERARNVDVARLLEGLGFEIYLPQEHGGVLADLSSAAAPARAAARARTFETDLQALRTCDVLVCLLDGRVPDEGTCVELGIAWALGKKCVGFKTDWRVHDPGGLNLMVEACLGGRVARDPAELRALLEETR
jgi:nucleoside 2-deoxyribosyltransferase